MPWRQGPVHSHHVKPIRELGEFFYHVAVMACKERHRRGEALGHWDPFLYNNFRRHDLHVYSWAKDNGSYSVVLALNGVSRATLTASGITPAQHDGSNLIFEEPERIAVTEAPTAAVASGVNRSHTDSRLVLSYKQIEVESWESIFKQELGATITTSIGTGEGTPVAASLAITFSSQTTFGWNTGGVETDEKEQTFDFDIPGTRVVGFDGILLPRIKDTAPPTSHQRPKEAPFEDWAQAIVYRAIAGQEIATFSQHVHGHGAYTVGPMQIRSNEKYGADKWNWEWPDVQYLQECMHGAHGNDVWPAAFEEDSNGQNGVQKLHDTREKLRIDFTYRFQGVRTLNLQEFQHTLGHGETSTLTGTPVTA